MTAYWFGKCNPGRFLLAALFFAAAGLTARAQVSAGNGPPIDATQMNPHFPDKTANIEREDVTQDMRRLRLLNSARQKAMISDADKLLALARDLNAGIGADGSALSDSQRMRMAADIERLAHSVKEKMSYVAGTPSPPRIPFSSWPQ